MKISYYKFTVPLCRVHHRQLHQASSPNGSNYSRRYSRGRRPTSQLLLLKNDRRLVSVSFGIDRDDIHDAPPMPMEVIDVVKNLRVEAAIYRKHIEIYLADILFFIK